jgi:hypothetical protein
MVVRLSYVYFHAYSTPLNGKKKRTLLEANERIGVVAEVRVPLLCLCVCVYMFVVARSTVILIVCTERKKERKKKERRAKVHIHTAIQ